MSKKKKKISKKKETTKVVIPIEKAIAQAENYLQSGKEQKIIPLLKAYQKNYEYKSDSLASSFNRLLAFGFAHNKNLLEAEKICLRELETDQHPLDFYFLTTFINLSLRHYDKALENAKEYLKLYAQYDNLVKNYTSRTSFLCQLNNYAGVALLETGKHDEAEKYFLDAKSADSKNHLPYLNLINLAQKNNDFKKANDILNEGIKHCHQIQELRMIENSLKNKVSISACMIVKNEEELLPDCLESIRDWVDEIIVVDTGSTDKTIEIAKSYGAKIYNQKWEGDFSKHRNYSIELATSEWVFIIDADERMYLEDVPQLRNLINSNDAEIISINVFNIYGENEEITTFLPSVRLWKKDKNLQYEGIVHNRLNHGKDALITRAGIRLKHLGYGLDPQKMHQKFLRTKELLEEQLSENNNDSFALFNYAQILKAEGDSYPIKNIPKIIESAKKAVDLTNPLDKEERYIHLMCLDQISWAYFYNNEYNKALEYAQRALLIKDNYLDPLMLIGCAESKQKNYDKAKRAFDKYLQVQEGYNPSTETENLILAHLDSRANVYYNLGLMALMEKDVDQAISFYEKAVQLNQGLLEVNDQLGQLYYQKNDLTQAKLHFENQIKFSTTTASSIVGLAEISKSQNDLTTAEDYYSQAITLYPNDSFVNYRYSCFCLEIGKPEEAVISLERCHVSQVNNKDVSILLADTYFQIQRYQDAVNLYQEIINEHGETSELLNDLGNSYFQMKKFEQAVDSYNKSLKTDSPLEFTYRNLALAQIYLKNYNESIKSLENYLINNKTDIEMLNVLGDVLQKTGEHKSALSKYEEVLRINSSDKHAIYQLSECYLIMGHRDSAVLGYQSLLTIDPDFKHAQDRLSQLQDTIYEGSKS